MHLRLLFIIFFCVTALSALEPFKREEAIVRALAGAGSYEAIKVEKERANSWRELYIINQAGSPRFVVKLYPEGSCQFLSDNRVQQWFSRLKLDLVKFANVVQSGKIAEGGEQYLFIVEEFLPGATFDKIRDPFAFKLLGQGLREFHDKSTHYVGPLHPLFFANMDKVILKGMEGLDIGSREKLFPVYLRAREKVIHTNFPRSYVHGDPNFNNFLLTEGKLGVIDLEAASEFVDNQGLGIATPLYDLLLLLDYIEETGSPELRVSFIEGYGGIDYDPEVVLYFRMADLFAARRWHEGVASKLSASENARVESVLIRKLKQVEKSAILTK